MQCPVDPMHGRWYQNGKILATAAAMLFLTGVHSKPRVAVEQLPPQKPLMIIDPGHGGVDEGTPVAGITEDEITYDVSVRVQELLQQRGYRTYRTVHDAETGAVPQENLQNGTREYLVAPEGNIPLTAKLLTKRCEIINAATRGKKTILVSIHADSTFPFRAGVRTFYPSEAQYGSKDSEAQSYMLANAIDAAMVQANIPTAQINYGGIPLFPIESVDATLLRDGELYRLAIFGETALERKVLVELANLQNPSDRESMLSANGRQSAAVAIAAGIEQYCRSTSSSNSGTLP